MYTRSFRTEVLPDDASIFGVGIGSYRTRGLLHEQHKLRPTVQMNALLSGERAAAPFAYLNDAFPMKTAGNPQLCGLGRRRKT